jgi:chromosome segregation ATPase
MDFPTLESLITLDSARSAYGQLLEAHERLLSTHEEMATSLNTQKVELDALKTGHATAMQTEQERMEALQEDLVAANSLLDEAGKENATLKADLNASKTSLEEFTQKLAQAEQKLTEAHLSISELESKAKSAEAKAAEICASVGVDPVAVKPDGGDSQQSILEQMRSIKNPAEQMAFFRKHREAILRGS